MFCVLRVGRALNSKGEPLPYPLCPLLGECAESQNVTASNCTL